MSDTTTVRPRELVRRVDAGSRPHLRGAILLTQNYLGRELWPILLIIGGLSHSYGALEGDLASDGRHRRSSERRKGSDMSRIAGLDYAKWLAVVLAYPIAGFLGRLIANPADGPVFAFVTAAVAGAILGVAQWFALGRHVSAVRWVGATALGLGVSFVIVQALGATSSSAAPVIGAVTGLGVGVAQSLVRSDRIPSPLLWIATMGVAWSIGWVVTTSIGVQAEAGWPVVGLSGALVAQALSGLVLLTLGRRRTQPAA
jgi:hypothetical protein